jgi:hypothetical protein
MGLWSLLSRKKETPRSRLRAKVDGMDAAYFERVLRAPRRGEFRIAVASKVLTHAVTFSRTLESVSALREYAARVDPDIVAFEAAGSALGRLRAAVRSDDPIDDSDEDRLATESTFLAGGFFEEWAGLKDAQRMLHLVSGGTGLDRDKDVELIALRLASRLVTAEGATWPVAMTVVKDEDSALQAHPRGPALLQFSRTTGRKLCDAFLLEVGPILSRGRVSE